MTNPRVLSRRYVLVSRCGFVLQTMSLIYRSPCAFDVSKFPFDEHTCSIDFATWAYPEHRYDTYSYRPILT